MDRMRYDDSQSIAVSSLCVRNQACHCNKCGTVRTSSKYWIQKGLTDSTELPVHKVLAHVRAQLNRSDKGAFQ